MHEIFAKNVVSIGKKPVPGVSETSNSAHRQITSCREKNLKITFFTGVRNIVKMESEIYKYILFFFSSCKIFDPVLRLVFNSSPQFHSHPACRALELQLTFFVNLADAVDCVQLVPKYYSKVKLRSWQSPNIFV